MPTTATDTRSVPRQFRQVKTQYPDFVQRLIDARIEARMEVMRDLRLTDGAARLYTFLDDDAGLKGREWTGTDTLAIRLGVSERIIFSRLKELEAVGHIARIRGKYQSEYRLRWAPRTEKNSSSQNYPALRTEDFSARELKISSKIDAVSINEPVLEPGACPYCNGAGTLQHEDRKWDGAVVRKTVKCSCAMG